MIQGLYEEEVLVERLVSAIAGKGEERTTLEEMRQLGGVLGAFADDDDLQQIMVASTNIGMVRRYTKRYAKKER